MESGRKPTLVGEGESLLQGMLRYGDDDDSDGGARRAQRLQPAVSHDRIRETNQQTRDVSGVSTMTGSRSLFQELERPAMARKKTRAVFDDLGTAHSTITGSERSRFLLPSSATPALNEESSITINQENSISIDEESSIAFNEKSSIPLQDLNHLNHPHLQLNHLNHQNYPHNLPSDNDSVASLLPTLPKPAAVPNRRRSRTPDDENLPAAKRLSGPRSWFDQHSKSATHSLKTKSSSRQVSWGTTLGSIKSIIASFTDLAAGNDRSDEHTASHSHWHRGSASNIAEEQSSKEQRHSARLETSNPLETVADSDNDDMDARDIRAALRPNESSYYHSSLEGPPSDTLPPHAIGRYIGPDGYGYNHFQTTDGRGLSMRDGSTVGNIYAHYMEGENDDLSDDDAHSPVSRKYVNTQASKHGFPSSPPLPPRSRYSAPKKSGQHPNFSLPKSAPNQHLAVQQQVVPSSSQPLSHRSSYENTGMLLDLPQPVQTEIGSNALVKAQEAPQVVISLAENAIAHPTSAPDQFLARKLDRLPLEKEVSRALRRASGFSAYSVGSIDTSHLDEPQYEEPSDAHTYRAIKSLLRENMGMGASSENQAEAPPTRGFFDKHAIPSDWIATQRETMVRVTIKPRSFPDSSTESPLDNELPCRKQDDANDWETVGESVGRRIPPILGGTVGRAGSSIANYSDDSIPELSSFNTMDRIAQHPGNIEYSGDYRQRDLKKTHIPVFLPVFREHKVNGYLADSNRFRPPPNPFFKTLAPLHKPHDNPFRAKAPAVTPRLKNQLPRNANVFPPAARAHAHKEPAVGGPRPNHANKKARAADDQWMKEFSDPGPMISSQSDQVFMDAAPENTSTWHDVIPYDGTHPPVGESSTDRDSKVLEWRYKQENQVEKLVDTGDHGGKPDRKKSHNPFGKRPPGAFYQNLRSVSASDGKGADASPQQPRARASIRIGGIKEYPTNTLRPLSLLKDRRPSTPQGQIIQDSNEPLENDFVYRSPLAPPRRSSWQQLYSENQMKEIKEAAKADGFFGSQISLSTSFRNSTRRLNPQKHLFEAPRLGVFSRNASHETGLMQQKKAFSITTLCLCSGFPPLLILYANGSLDGLVGWWTRGQCSTFGKGHKRVATILLYVWGLLIFIALIAFLIVWFAVIKPHRTT